MNEKDLYKLFNHVKLDESELDNLEEEVSTMQKKRIKSKLNKKIKDKKNKNIIKYGSTASALVLVGLMGINTVSPTFAENIPVIGSIVQGLNEKMGIYGDYEEYSQMVGKSVTDKGITFTINEVMADESRLIIGYTVKSDNKLENKEFEGHFSYIEDFKINGKRISGGGGSLGDYVDEYTYVGSHSVDISRVDIPEEFKVNLNISEIMQTKGKWKIAFSGSKEEISKNSTVFKPSQKVEFDDSTVIVDRVEFSPLGTYISLSGDYKIKPDESAFSTFEYDYWLAFDDQGVELTSNGIGGGGNSKKDFYSQMTYVKVDHIPKYLTILPLKIIPTGGGGVSFDADGKETHFEMETKEPTQVKEVIDGRYPKELKQGKFGKLIINEITTVDNTTTVRLIAEGKAPHFQANNFNIIDEQGENIMITSRDIRRNPKNPNDFTIEFEALDANKEYYISTTEFDNIEFDETMRFKIKLEK